jgi:hypothetical protein
LLRADGEEKLSMMGKKKASVERKVHRDGAIML